MNIGNVKIESPVFLAPMAGYTDRAFRILCKEQGAGVVYTEFVSSEGIIRGSEKTQNYLTFDDIERPIGIQIFGHNPKSMAEAAKYIEENYKPDIIDLNFGCPVKKVTKKGAGSSLLRNLPLMAEIARKVIKSVNTPVTAKIRSGWNNSEILATKAAKILEGEGVAALTIHPRTASSRYNQPANWNIIADVKSKVKIPVIGNGDIKTPEDAGKMFKETGCDAVMIGRGALGNPLIFRNTIDYLKGSKLIPTISPISKINFCLHHISLESKMREDVTVNKIMKKYYRWYFRELPNASEIRTKLVKSPNLNETIKILESFKTYLFN